MEEHDYTREDRKDLAYLMRQGINANIMSTRWSAKPGVAHDDKAQESYIYVRDLQQTGRTLKVKVSVEEVDDNQDRLDRMTLTRQAARRPIREHGDRIGAGHPDTLTGGEIGNPK